MIIYNQKMLYAYLGLLIIGLYLALLPNILHARILINEIMYDPEGSDTGREWVEVFNSGTETIDLSSYKLFESNVNHKLSLFSSENLNISAGQFAIIADNPEKFLIDFPNFAGLLIDSAFSLNNTGEIISIIDKENNIIDTVTYSVDWGGKNNSFSLQKNSNNFWIEAKPTVALKNTEQSETVVENETGSSISTNSGTSSAGSTHSSQTEISKYNEKITLEIGAGRNRYSTIKTPIEFIAKYNTDRKPKFMWSFGDGSSATGLKTSHFYKNSGTYNIVLNALLNKEQATTRLKVYISDVSVDIMSITRGKDLDIVLKNLDTKELNVGGFIIKSGKNSFEIPADTIIDPNSQVIIPFEYTGFEINNDFKPAEFYYPEGGLIIKENMTDETVKNLVNIFSLSTTTTDI